MMLRRVRLRRDAQGGVVRSEVPAILASLPQCAAPKEDIDAIKKEAGALREQLAERDRQLAEWQTCHESVERELKRASQRASTLQMKINETSNELARTRADLNKARTEAEAHRKANEALNRQLQGILKANQGKPTSFPPEARPAGKRKSGDKPPGELAA
jgi:septal ring factor EnvC (AmiA/AmiB activator)